MFILGQEDIFKNELAKRRHVQTIDYNKKLTRPLPTPKEVENEQGEKIIYDAFSDKELRYRQR